MKKRLVAWGLGLPWEHLLTVRRGFWLGALAGFSVAGSVLWAIPSVMTYLPGHPPEPFVLRDPNLPIPRNAVPAELAWFFIQYPYVSEAATIRSKNRHAFLIEDAPRRRHYVVALGQRYRRVEIYAAGSDEAQVHLYMPGAKKTVSFRGPRIIGQSSAPDGNLWMWNGPLWNATHLKIYGLADLWLNSPYKRYSCAGFVHKFLRDAGIHVPVLDAWDMARQPWVRVPIEELEPGDILTIQAATPEHRRFWGHRVTHVGVYVGQGKFIHAATASRKAKRAFIRLADVDDFRRRIDKILRPPELL